MKQVLCAVGMTVFLLSGNLWGQQWGDWVGAANDYTIGYRYRVLNNRKACDLEFRDQNQRNGYTTFDAAVDYQTTASDTNSTAPNSGNPDNTPPSNNRAPNNARVTKTDGEHIVTTTTHNGSAQIPNCFVVKEVRVSFIQRQ
ncbi:MAG: hypothetical protein WBX03_12055 [Terriglobales bacterium]